MRLHARACACVYLHASMPEHKSDLAHTPGLVASEQMEGLLFKGPGGSQRLAHNTAGTLTYLSEFEPSIHTHLGERCAGDGGMLKACKQGLRWRPKVLHEHEGVRTSKPGTHLIGSQGELKLSEASLRMIGQPSEARGLHKSPGCCCRAHAAACPPCPRLAATTCPGCCGRHTCATILATSLYELTGQRSNRLFRILSTYSSGSKWS